jgi:acetyl esterase
MSGSFHTEERVYKIIDGHEVKVRLFIPEDGKKARPAIVFFFGGGWWGGSWEQFRTHSEFLASQGFVAMTAQYRNGSIHGAAPHECVEDAKDMFTWAVCHAGELGVDRARVAVAGGSSGGHLALCTGMLSPDERTREERGGISPKAMVLFNPVCDTSQRARFGDYAVALSPIHHVAAGQPPALLFHGTADTTVLFGEIVEFAEKMRACGNEITVEPYEGRVHGFFNLGRSESDEDYKDTLQKTYAFLQERLK